MVQKKHREFWQQWSQEYLTRLQQRPKWLRTRENLEIGDLVMINEPNTPPTKWQIGRIKDVHPGSDGMVRVATIRTPDGTCRRPVVKLCLLPSQRAMEWATDKVENPPSAIKRDETDGSMGKLETTVECRQRTQEGAKMKQQPSGSRGHESESGMNLESNDNKKRKRAMSGRGKPGGTVERKKIQPIQKSSRNCNRTTIGLHTICVH